MSRHSAKKTIFEKSNLCLMALTLRFRMKKIYVLCLKLLKSFQQASQHIDHISSAKHRSVTTFIDLRENFTTHLPPPHYYIDKDQAK